MSLSRFGSTWRRLQGRVARGTSVPFLAALLVGAGVLPLAACDDGKNRMEEMAEEVEDEVEDAKDEVEDEIDDHS